MGGYRKLTEVILLGHAFVFGDIGLCRKKTKNPKKPKT